LAPQLIVPDQASETYNRILEEVQAISCATLFAPVMSNEAVQAMSTLFMQALQLELMCMLVLVSGWSDNGWLSGGHAVRMAMELCKFTFHFLLVYNSVTTSYSYA
jgi:hypothetical protein